MNTAQNANETKEIKIYWILLGEFAAWVGSSFVWPLTSVYLNKQLHVSLSMIGVVLFFNSGANIVGSAIAGKLFDKMNPYPLIIFGSVADALVLFLLAAFHGWPEYWLWLTLTGFFSGWNGTIINSISTSLKRYSTKQVFSLLYFAQNLGVVTGTLIVGYLYDYSVTLLFIIAALLFVVVAFNAIINYRPIILFHKMRQKQNIKKQTIKNKMPKVNKLLIYSLFICLVLTWLMYMNWESNLSVYMVSLGIPFHLYSLLWTLNAGIIVLVQVILTRFPKIFKTSFQQVAFGILMFSISFVTLIFAKDFTHFAISMTILTFGEATAFPAIPAYVNDLTPLQNKGQYQGLTMVASSIGRALGPLIGGLIIDATGYISLFVVAAIVIFTTLVILVPIHERIKKKLVFFK